MPKVGNKEFAYTEAGMTEAKKHAEKIGEDIPTYNAGGRVKKIQGYGDGGEVKRAKREMADKVAGFMGDQAYDAFGIDLDYEEDLEEARKASTISNIKE